MSLVGRILWPQARVTFDEMLERMDGRGPMSGAGKTVTSASALEVTAVLACVRVLAEGVSQVPFKLYRAEGRNRVEAKEHPLYRLLHRRPNAWQTSFEFRETMVLHTALKGNFFAFKNRSGNNGTIGELIPLERCRPEWDSDIRRVRYYVEGKGGEREFPAESIWHVKGPSWNSWCGLSAVEKAREAIGLSMATEEAHAKLHKNGVQSSGLYSIDGSLGPEQYKNLRNWIEKEIGGPNRSSVLVLDRNAKFTPMHLNGVDAQHLETRKHQIEEICRAFRVMPIMIGQADKAATYASAEQMFLAHVVHTLTPWYERIEQSVDVNLLSEADAQRGVYAKFNPNGLMRGAAKDRAEYYYRRWMMGSMSPNQIRELEDENPYEGGDSYFVTNNVIATDAAREAAQEDQDNATA